MVEIYASIIAKKMLTNTDPGYVDLTSPAGIGIGALVYNYDGDIYASDEGRMLAEMGDRTFRLGTVHDSYADIMLSDALLNPLSESITLSAPMCATCAFGSRDHDADLQLPALRPRPASVAVRRPLNQRLEKRLPRNLPLLLGPQRMRRRLHHKRQPPQPAPAPTTVINPLRRKRKEPSSDGIGLRSERAAHSRPIETESGAVADRFVPQGCGTLFAWSCRW